MTVQIVAHELPKHHLFNDLTGKTYGRLSVISYAGKTGKRKLHSWYCKCECGKIHITTSSKLGEGSVKSCGCYRSDLAVIRNTTHGMKKTPEYQCWRGILNRCLNKNTKSYKDYGGRGIGVCDRWINSFENFYSDMGDRPKGRTIDRIDNSKGYSKDNCRWATPKEQASNRRNPTRKPFAGVFARDGKWTARISINGKYLSLGAYDDFFEACCARKSAENRH